MDRSRISAYACPVDRSALRLEQAVGSHQEVSEGTLVSPAGRRYRIDDGIPDFIEPDTLSEPELKIRTAYDRAAETGAYDTSIDWMFGVFGEDEGRARAAAHDLMELEPDHKVLEVGCGTGRDTHRIAGRLGSDGAMFATDLSPAMVSACRSGMAKRQGEEPIRCALEYSVANAVSLPFATDVFDAVFHSGGFNQFSSQKQAAAEFARVVKPGGLVLFADESVAPWLRGTEFARIVCANNPLFDSPLPLDALPECAGDVSVRYVVGNCFYIITFRKHDEPPRNIDRLHKGDGVMPDLGTDDPQRPK